ncbi:hypothetical protein L1987_08936 [Smallanthus sonchifolius]|uniref:Uncharacterized protein n=1 Tax=Smallanthus sonchifolius TaxID=185202 RepID=A0ACB9JM29_9ASTR|nr:hypothetical protein L1987_08936 [Smallanthus sonchifolius]
MSSHESFDPSNGGVSDSSEGSVSLPSNGSGCCYGDSPSVATGNDDAMQMMCPSSTKCDMVGVNLPSLQCMYVCYVYQETRLEPGSPAHESKVLPTPPARVIAARPGFE